jgi:hypothetical protein
VTRRRHVSEADANKVLREVRRAFAAYCQPGWDQPTLVRAWDWAPGCDFAILWEGGPDGWAHLTHGGVDEEMTSLYAEEGSSHVARVAPMAIPPTVYVEPYASWALCLYPAS